MNNVFATQDSTSLTIVQRHSLSYKLIIITLLLLLGAALPAYGVYVFGSNATLTCSREPSSGVVCTDRVDWLGAFPRTWSYERVERAEVLTDGRDRQTTFSLRLITAAGPVVFSADHHSAYASAADLINGFIESRPARPLVLSAGTDWPGVAGFSGILLVVAYFCLAMLLKTGAITRFDATQGRIYLRREGFLRPKDGVLRIDEVVSVYATPGSLAEVFLRTRDAQHGIGWFSNANSSNPSADARELAQMIIRWLAQYQQATTPC